MFWINFLFVSDNQESKMKSSPNGLFSSTCAVAFISSKISSNGLVNCKTYRITTGRGLTLAKSISLVKSLLVIEPMP